MPTASPLSRGADATKIRAPDKHAYPGPSTAFISSSPALRLVGRSFAGEKLIAAHALVASEKFFRHANDPHHIDPTAYLEKLLTQASPDLMREMLGDFINQILSTQADAVCDADYGTTSDNRVNHRNGYRHRPLDTRVGTVDVAIPKLRHGSFFPWAVSNIVDGRTLDYGAWWQITFLPNHTGWNPGCLPNGGQAPSFLGQEVRHRKACAH